MLCWWIVGLSTPSFAQPAPPDAEEARLAQARELYKLGAGLYKAGRYKEAIGSFEEAYELSDNKKILYNIANAQERLGNLQGAIDSLMEYRPHANPSDVVSLDLRIAAIEDRMADLPASPPGEDSVKPRNRAEATVREMPPSFAQEAITERRPRWILVGTGAAISVGFGALSVATYLQGVDNRGTNDENSYRTNRTLNNIAVPLASVGGGLAILGLALQKERTVMVSANPSGATLRLKF